MKVGVITMALNEERFIRRCIQQFPLEQRPGHVVAISDVSWNGYEIEPDNTAQIAIELGAQVIHGKWRLPSEQLNSCLFLLDHEGYDWAIICDADEFYDDHSLEILYSEIQRARYPLVPLQWHVYWKSAKYKLYPEPQPWPPVIACPVTERFSGNRIIGGPLEWSKAVLHHFSYVRNDEEMLKKVKMLQEAGDFDAHAWYENVWLKWTPEMENLHPVVPNQFHRAVYDPAPYTVIPSPFVKR